MISSLINHSTIFFALLSSTGISFFPKYLSSLLSPSETVISPFSYHSARRALFLSDKSLQLDDMGDAVCSGVSWAQRPLFLLPVPGKAGHALGLEAVDQLPALCPVVAHQLALPLEQESVPVLLLIGEPFGHVPARGVAGAGEGGPGRAAGIRYPEGLRLVLAVYIPGAR